MSEKKGKTPPAKITGIDVLRRPQDPPLGYSLVLGPTNAPLRDLKVGRLRLDEKVGGYSGKSENRETLLHILTGECTVEAEGKWGKRSFTKLGERRDVFSGNPTSILLPPGTSYNVIPTSRTLDAAIASLTLEAGKGSPPTVIRPQDVREHAIGEEHYSRHVREVIGGEGPAVRMRAGETINPVGKWSSWPHHDFDANPELAPKFEEVFLYFTKPRDGWGIQVREGLYCNLERVDDTFVVRNGDAAVVPLGEHPLVSGVDSSIMYIWFYVSPIAKTYARWAEDIGGYA